MIFDFTFYVSYTAPGPISEEWGDPMEKFITMSRAKRLLRPFKDREVLVERTQSYNEHEEAFTVIIKDSITREDILRTTLIWEGDLSMDNIDAIMDMLRCYLSE